MTGSTISSSRSHQMIQTHWIAADGRYGLRRDLCWCLRWDCSRWVTRTTSVGGRGPVWVVGAVRVCMVSRRRRPAVIRNGRATARIIVRRVVGRRQTKSMVVLRGPRPTSARIPIIVCGGVLSRRRIQRGIFRRRVLRIGPLLRLLLRPQRLPISTKEWCPWRDTSRNSRNRDKRRGSVTRHRLKYAIYPKFIAVGAFAVVGVGISTASDLS